MKMKIMAVIPEKGKGEKQNLLDVINITYFTICCVKQIYNHLLLGPQLEAFFYSRMKRFNTCCYFYNRRF